jgi:hypothetical protein
MAPGVTMTRYAITYLILLALVGCMPSTEDTAAFCGIWKREFSPLDPNYHLLKSFEGRGEELGLGPLAFESLKELFYVEQTGPSSVMVYDQSGEYRGKVEFKLGAGYVLIFGTPDREFQCTVSVDRVKAEMSERATGEAGIMDFSVRRPFEGEAGLWKDKP